ncbi:MAG: hypothetical protein M1820_001595 [Bogoriella megaspora]|nr:MAG: hypothetical protein M1820_001595 [Bogoriella megaspora]
MSDPLLLGQGSGFGDVETLLFYQQKGKTRMEEYSHALISKTEDTKVLNDVKEVDVRGKTSFLDIRHNAKYLGVSGSRVFHTFPELKVFREADLSLDVKTLKSLREITVSDATSKAIIKPIINRGTYDPNGEVIIAQVAFKANDQTPRDSPERVPVNEISWQAYASVAKGTDKQKRLKVIFFMDIQNRGFWSITAQNYEQAGIPTDKMHVWTAADHLESFQRFIGSDTINGKVRFLTNHHIAIGNKTLAKVITIPKQVPGSQGRFTAALVLGPAG